METHWQLQDAKARFSELVERAITEGPQMVTRHGRETAVLLSVEDYRRLSRKPEESLVDFFRRAAGPELHLDLRDDFGRAVEL